MPITCSGFELTARARTPLSIAFKCDGGDPGHGGEWSVEVVEPPKKGIFTFDAAGYNGPRYTALRSGRDRFVLRLSDGMSSAQTTISTINDYQDIMFPGPGPEFPVRPNRRRAFTLESPGLRCSDYPNAADCSVEAKVRAVVRVRGKRRTLTLGKVSHTLSPRSGRHAKVKLTTTALRILRRVGRIRATVFLEHEQLDPFGIYTEERNVKVTILKPKRR